VVDEHTPASVSIALAHRGVVQRAVVYDPTRNDLCYVAAGYYDGFFETGLNPWDIAAGSLIITEAGGLVGNFTGEVDFLHQRELVCGNPKVYGQLVGILSSYTRVIKDAGGAASPASPEEGYTPDATEAFIADATAKTAADAPAAKERKPIRVTGPRTPKQRGN
jgi:myo-inositol-1(or 4)-monophosphatase